MRHDSRPLSSQWPASCRVNSLYLHHAAQVGSGKILVLRQPWCLVRCSDRGLALLRLSSLAVQLLQQVKDIALNVALRG